MTRSTRLTILSLLLLAGLFVVRERFHRSRQEVDAGRIQRLEADRARRAEATLWLADAFRLSRSDAAATRELIDRAAQRDPSWAWPALEQIVRDLESERLPEEEAGEALRHLAANFPDEERIVAWSDWIEDRTGASSGEPGPFGRLIDRRQAAERGDERRAILEEVERFRKRYPSFGPAWTLAGRLRLDLGQRNEGMGDLSIGLDLFAAQPEAHALRIETLLAANRVEEAVRALEEGRPYLAEPRLQEALVRIRQGRLVEAERILRALTTEDSTGLGIHARAALAQLLAGSQRFEEALGVLDRATAEEASSGSRAEALREIALLRGRLLTETQRLEEARAALLVPLRATGGDPEVYRWLARIEELARCWNRARHYHRKVLVTLPDDRTALLGLVRVSRLEGDPEAGLVACRTFFAEFPGEPEGVLEQARCLLDLDRSAEALRKTQGLEAEPSIRLLQARARLALGDRDTAQEIVEEVLERDPYDPEALLVRAEIERRQGDRNESLRWIERALRAAPDRAEPRLARARHHHESGKTEEALAELARALRVDPYCLEARLQAGRLGLEAGMATEVEGILEAGIALHPENDPLNLLLKRTREALKR